MASELGTGSKVAIIGGGVSGAAMACSLAQNARSRGKTVDVRIYDGGVRKVEAPLVLTAECRSRLAGLGCRAPIEWKALELRGIEVVSGTSREVLPAPAGSLWVVDRWAAGKSGERLVAEALAQIAIGNGAKVIERTVDAIDLQPVIPGVHQLGRNAGEHVVRSGGSADRFNAVVLACGAAGALSEAFFEGHAGAPTIPAVHARLRHGVFRSFGPQLARLILAPLPGVDALLLVPGQGSTYAIAHGPAVTPADLCQAVMNAARDGLIPDAFELAELETTRIAYGAGTKLAAKGRITVGTAAFGHPLQLGISEALASCSRAAMALVESARDGEELQKRYVREALFDLLQDANDGARAMAWLRRAGARAPKALLRCRMKARPTVPFAGGILALPSPSPREVLSAARRAALIEGVIGWFWLAANPLPAAALIAEPDLYYVVDDDPDAREALTSYLENSGAQVVAFADELSLFAAVARRPPTAILLDVVLNWVDGLRLCEGLKQHPLTRGVPVYVMSGLNRPHIVARALDAGAEAFLPKPLNPARITELVRGLGGSGVPRPVEPLPAALPPIGADLDAGDDAEDGEIDNVIDLSSRFRAVN